jgi:hypothetical protein
MMRTIEILLVIIIITGAFIISSFFAVLPQPRRVAPINLRRLALTTLQTLDSDHDLSMTVFMPKNDPSWSSLEIALSSCLPPNIVYNLTIYRVQTGVETNATALYEPCNSISNVENLGVGSDASSILVASSNVTFKITAEKIGENGDGGTLYILNCSDSNGWWISGYTAQTLAEDIRTLLSPYFQENNIIILNDTAQLGQVLDGNPIKGEKIQNAIIINTFGEAVPIPTDYADRYPNDNYAQYCHQLGNKTLYYNWTWTSIVGDPFHYVTNTVEFSGTQSWGIYGTKTVGQKGLTAFLRGLNNLTYTTPTDTPYKEIGIVKLTSPVLTNCTNYGIYPSPSQTSSRALNNSIQQDYNLSPALQLFDPSPSFPTWVAGALYEHKTQGIVSGRFLALGLARTPDIRLTAIALLSYFQPRLYPAEHTAKDTSRLVTLQLGQVGGV